MTEQSLTISFANRISDQFWLRMELVEEETTMTVGEAADFIDQLYNVSVCGQEPIPEKEPEEKPDGTDWDRAFAQLGSLPTCDAYDALAAGDNGAYEVDIKVWRSHPRSELYKLILSNGYAGAPRLVNERVTVFIEIEDKSSHLMDMPIMDRPQITWQDIDGPDINIKGNTLWWEGNVTGTIRAEFGTRYDLVHIRVTGITNTTSQIIEGTVDDRWLGAGWYSGSETGEELTDVQNIQCSVLAFYHYQYEELVLNKPETDESVSGTDSAAVCRYAGSTHVNDDEGFNSSSYDITACKESCARRYEAGSQELADCQKACERTCFKTVKYSTICTCGGDESTTTEEVPVVCPDGYNTGSSVDGGATEDGGYKYINCGADDVSQAWFYEEKCCVPWPFGDDVPMPQCEEKHEPFVGQGLTGEQTAALKQKYGDNANIIAVGPKEGKCGEIITTQDVNQASCCDEVTQIYWDADNSVEVIADDSFGIVAVTGGVSPYSWSVRGDGFFVDANYTKRDITTTGNYIHIYTQNSCGNCTITVTDGCTSVSESIKSSEGQWSGDCKVFVYELYAGAGNHDYYAVTYCSDMCGIARLADPIPNTGQDFIGVMHAVTYEWNPLNESWRGVLGGCYIFQWPWILESSWSSVLASVEIQTYEAPTGSNGAPPPFGPSGSENNCPGTEEDCVWTC